MTSTPNNPGTPRPYPSSLSFCCLLCRYILSFKFKIIQQNA